MRRLSRAGLFGGALLLLAAGCGAAVTPESIEAGLKEATAVATGVSDIASIEISNQERVTAKWTWNAKIAGQSYACDSDEQMRLPACQAIS